MQPFGEPQAERVDGPEVGLVVRRADRVDQAPDLFDREHVGQCLLFGDAELSERLPLPRHGVRVEVADAVEGHLQRGRGELLLVLQKQEVVTDVLLAELIGRLAVVIGQLPHRPKIRLLRPLAKSGNLKVLGHLLAKRGHTGTPWKTGERNLSQGWHATSPIDYNDLGKSLPRSGLLEQRDA